MHQSFAAEPSAVAEARTFARHAVTSLSCPHAADDAMLVVSELVTNAVRAGARRVGVDLSCDNGLLRIRVSDDGAGWPRVGKPGPTARSGRGLVLVAAVAEDWGVERLDSGKEVWAELSVVDRPRVAGQR